MSGDNDRRPGNLGKRKLAEALSPSGPFTRGDTPADGPDSIAQVCVLGSPCFLVPWAGCSGCLLAQVPRLVEFIKARTHSLGEEASSKASLRKAVHTLTELAKTGAHLGPWLCEASAACSAQRSLCRQGIAEPTCCCCRGQRGGHRGRRCRAGSRAPADPLPPSTSCSWRRQRELVGCAAASSGHAPA